MHSLSSGCMSRSGSSGHSVAPPSWWHLKRPPSSPMPWNNPGFSIKLLSPNFNCMFIYGCLSVVRNLARTSYLWCDMHMVLVPRRLQLMAIFLFECSAVTASFHTLSEWKYIMYWSVNVYLCCFQHGCEWRQKWVWWTEGDFCPADSFILDPITCL